MRVSITVLLALAACDEPQPEPVLEPVLELRMDDFAVSTDQTTYACRRFELPIDGPRDIVAFAPLVDDRQHVHHMILYRVDAAIDDGELCYPSPLDPWVVWGWAPGGVPLELPE